MTTTATNPLPSAAQAPAESAGQPVPPVTCGTPSTGFRLTAVLLLATGCLSLAPMPVLGPAIGWPDSLGQPAAIQLAAIAQAPDAVAAGYGLYMLYSLLVLPALGLGAHQVLGHWSRRLVALIMAFAALSTLARCVGILRWLTVMPDLALAHAAADAATKPSIERIFDALNGFGGGIGELLGVSLFTGVALLLLVAGAALARAVPRWLTGLGALAVIALLGLFLPAVGFVIEVPIVWAVALLTLWMWGLGGWLLGAHRRREA